MKILHFFLATIAFYGSADAQTIIRGKLTDSTGSPLYPATLELLRLPDSVRLSERASGKDGFSLRAPEPGKYILKISFIGYRPMVLPLVIGKTDKEIDEGTLRLIKQDADLAEVIVKMTLPPVMVKKDTVVYQAGAFKTRPNATVEDLLKKLPGIEVDKEGNITMQGQAVEKIYIDGQEFFLNDPKLATRNFTADMIQSVEAYDANSDKGNMTGIKDPQGKAINLKLKKEKKQGIFGQAYAGYGNSDAWSAGGTATSMAAKNWLFGSFQGNNINDLFTGPDHGGGSIADGRRTNNVLNLNYKDRSVAFDNFILEYSGNESHSSQLQNGARQSFLQDSTLLQNSSGGSQSTTTNHHFGGGIKFALDSLDQLFYQPSFSYQTSSNNQFDSLAVSVEKNGGTYASTQATTASMGSSNGYTQNNGLIWVKKFQKTQRLLYANFVEGSNSQDQHGGLQTQTRFFDSTGLLTQTNAVNQQYNGHIQGNNYSLDLSYHEPLAKGLGINANYSFSASQTASDKNSFDFNPLSGRYDLPDSLTTSHFINKNSSQQFSIGVHGGGEKMNYRISMGSQLCGVTNTNALPHQLLEQHFINWIPYASINYSFSRNDNLRVEYRGNSTNPSIDQIQPLPDLSNPLLIRIGNPDLRPQFNHALDLDYRIINRKAGTGFFVRVTGNLATDKIVPYNLTLASGIQQTKFVNVNGAYSINSIMSYGLPLNHRRNEQIKLTTVLRYANDISFVNGQEDIQKAFSGHEALGINYNLDPKLFVEAQGVVDYSITNYSIQPGHNTDQLNWNYSINFNYLFPLDFNLSSNYLFQVTGSQGGLPGKQVGSWNASLYKSFLHDNAGEIRLSAFDLLDTRNNFSQSSGPGYISTQSSNTLGRVILLSFIYRFKSFTKAT